MERLVVQVGNGGVANLAQVVGQNLGRQAYGNTLGSLRQQQRELDRQRNGLLLAAVVRKLPLSGFGVEQHVEGKLGEACLDVTRRRCRVARKDVSPVSLAVNEQVLLPQLHQGIANGSIAVRVVLHGIAHNVGHLVVAAVVLRLHGVQNAPLYGFQSVGQMRDGTLQNHIGSIVEKPVLIHTGQELLGVGAGSSHGMIAAMRLGRFVLRVFGLVTHIIV